MKFILYIQRNESERYLFDLKKANFYENVLKKSIQYLLYFLRKLFLKKWMIIFDFLFRKKNSLNYIYLNFFFIILIFLKLIMILII